MKKRLVLKGMPGMAFLGVLSALVMACYSPVQPPIENPPAGSETGSISGSAFYQNETNHGGIAITLEKTDGLRTSAAIRSVTAARVLLNGDGETYTETSGDGTYSFDAVPVGTYTIYASSAKSKERAVTTNVTVSESQSVTAADLNLTPVGSISGTITVDGNAMGNLGFLVFIASTSYMAVTGEDGSFTISDVPVGAAYQIIIMKGNYTAIWQTASVTAGAATTLTAKNLLSADLTPGGGNSLVWKGSLAVAPTSPTTNWAYYNTADKKSYIWDGSAWQILSQDGSNGTNGTNGTDGTNGTNGT
jgi:hypothetical protein